MGRVRAELVALTFALLLLGAAPAQAASLSLARSGQVRVGTPVTLTVMVDTTGQPVNAIQANLSFPVGRLACGSLAVELTTWPVVAEQTCVGGLVKVAVGSFTPRVGRRAVAKVSLMPLSRGSANVRFAPGSAVVESVTNTRVLRSARAASFTVRP